MLFVCVRACVCSLEPATRGRPSSPGGPVQELLELAMCARASVRPLPRASLVATHGQASFVRLFFEPDGKRLFLAECIVGDLGT